jgi:hypothetical protein
MVIMYVNSINDRLDFGSKRNTARAVVAGGATGFDLETMVRRAGIEPTLAR